MYRNQQQTQFYFCPIHFQQQLCTRLLSRLSSVHWLLIFRDVCKAPESDQGFTGQDRRSRRRATITVAEVTSRTNLQTSRSFTFIFIFIMTIALSLSLSWSGHDYCAQLQSPECDDVCMNKEPCRA